MLLSARFHQNCQAAFGCCEYQFNGLSINRLTYTGYYISKILHMQLWETQVSPIIACVMYRVYTIIIINIQWVSIMVL